MASFGSKFAVDLRLCHLCVIALPKFDRIPVTEPLLLMVNPEDKEAETFAHDAITYLKDKKPQYVALLINAGGSQSADHYKACPSVGTLEGMFKADRVYNITMFSEETLARVAFLMISIGKQARASKKA